MPYMLRFTTVNGHCVCYCVLCSYADMYSDSVPVQVWNRETGEVVQADASGCQRDEVGESSGLLQIRIYVIPVTLKTCD